MSDEENFAIAFPAQEFGIVDDPNGAGAIIHISAGGETTATTFTPEQLSSFAALLLAWAGSSEPSPHHLLQTTEPGTLSARPIGVQRVGLTQGENEREVVLAFPVGRLTLAFAVPFRPLAELISRWLAGQRPGAPPKSN